MFAQGPIVDAQPWRSTMRLSGQDTLPMGEPDTPCSTVLLQARNLTFSHGAHAVLGPLNFSVGPGLTWVCGGDGRG